MCGERAFIWRHTGFRSSSCDRRRYYVILPLWARNSQVLLNVSRSEDSRPVLDHDGLVIPALGLSKMVAQRSVRIADAGWHVSSGCAMRRRITNDPMIPHARHFGRSLRQVAHVNVTGLGEACATQT